MGVPKFYRWISERYPCLSEVLKEYQVAYDPNPNPNPNPNSSLKSVFFTNRWLVIVIISVLHCAMGIERRLYALKRNIVLDPDDSGALLSWQNGLLY